MSESESEEAVQASSGNGCQIFSEIELDSYDTDKPPAYLETYAKEFGHLAKSPITLLELGVQRCGSMLLWRDVFPSGSIAGLDLNPIEVDDPTGRVHIYQGFQQDPDILDLIAREVAPTGFDVIIDDASHIGRYTARSFWHLFPDHLKSGGVYIIDDWDTAYRQDWPDGHRCEGDPSKLRIGKESFRKPSLVEMARRSVRSRARPIARRLDGHPSIRSKFERLYMKLEGGTMKTRIPNHDYGMAGFGKQLVDACAIDFIGHRPEPGGRSARLIDSVRFTPNQIIVRKVR